MRTFMLYSLLCGMVALVAVAACKREDPRAPVVTPSRPSTPNIPPIANAGPDRAGLLTTDSVVLRGVGTDADGTIVKYVWSITAYYSGVGRYVSFEHTGQVVTLHSLQQGTYWCKLTVTDNGGLTHSDEMVFHVVAAGCPCYPYPCDTAGDPCDPWDY